MRRPWSRSAGDRPGWDADTVAVVLLEHDGVGPEDGFETIDVVPIEDEAADAFLALLHELALEAIALRASSPGDPRSEPTRPAPPPDEGGRLAALVRRLRGEHGVDRRAA